MQRYTIYLSGEIHTDWRDKLKAGISSIALPVDILGPVLDHELSDSIGATLLGAEENPFWHDYKSAGINAIRNRNSIDRSDIVVIRFGDSYRQWNAAFDAGYAAAKGKPLITLHDESLDHSLKEVDNAALATARTPEQVVAILKYILTK
ncbi:MAG: YtoQ family protein [Gammaproteobacteria bacterium]|nr:YtoQ family protein [Gammaproteobacteria bacterium]